MGEVQKSDYSDAGAINVPRFSSRLRSHKNIRAIITPINATRAEIFQNRIKPSCAVPVPSGREKEARTRDAVTGPILLPMVRNREFIEEDWPKSACDECFVMESIIETNERPRPVTRISIPRFLSELLLPKNRE